MAKKSVENKREYDIEAGVVTIRNVASGDELEFSPDLPEGILPLHRGMILSAGADLISSFLAKQKDLGIAVAAAFLAAKADIVAKLADGTLPTRKSAAGDAAITMADKYDCLVANFSTHFGHTTDVAVKFRAVLDAAWNKTTEIEKVSKSGEKYLQVRRTGLSSLINSSPKAQEVLGKYLADTSTDALGEF